jgi:hypothetical protein
MKIKKPKFNCDVTETRQTQGHFDFSVEVIHSRNGWAELIPEDLDIVSALYMAEQLSAEGAKLYFKHARVLSPK